MPTFDPEKPHREPMTTFDPADFHRDPVTDPDVPVVRVALPLTEAVAGRRLEELPGDVVRR